MSGDALRKDGSGKLRVSSFELAVIRSVALCSGKRSDIHALRCFISLLFGMSGKGALAGPF